MKNTVNILGTEYKIEIHKCDEDSYLKDNQFAGYCCEDIPLIVIADLDDTKHFVFTNDADKDNYFKRAVRHEIVHAFLFMSGLGSDFEHVNKSGHEETMVDWFAIQYPKIKAVYDELGV